MKPLATPCTRGLRRALAPARAAMRARRLRLGVTLAWRRPARAPAASRPAMPGAALAIAVNAAWHAHLHLHAAAQSPAATGRAAPHAGASASPARDVRPGRPSAPIAPAPRGAVMAPARGRLDLAVRTPEAPSPSMPRPDASSRPAIVARQARMSCLAPAITHHVQATGTTRLLPRALAASENERAAAPPAAPRQAVATPTPATLVPPPRRAILPAQPAAAIDASGTAPPRRVDLVWRKPAATIASDADALDAAANAPTSHAAQIAASLPPAAPTAWAHLDPALADRLADEVLKRVERQARIARERRGL